MVDISFSRLEKNCKLVSGVDKLTKMAILANCSTQHLAKAIKGYGYERSLMLDIYDADYNQIEAQLFDNDSEIYEFNPKYVILYICSEKLYDDFCKLKQEQKETFAEDMMERLTNYWNIINNNLGATVLQFNFVHMDDKAFGNFSGKVSSSFAYQLRKLNYLMMTAISEYKGVFTIDIDCMQSLYGAGNLYDSKMYYIAKMPISVKMLPEVAKQVIDVTLAIEGKFKKCVVLDLDNTIWGGTIGDDGIENIQIGELGVGQAFSRFQTWLKELKNRGIILAVCSKNNEDVAKEPFEKHPEMVLRLDDISVFIANWEDKAQNIKKIQEILNIGMDSMVFIDDNPFERGVVKNLIPDITVPDLPEDPAQYMDYLKELNLFETASFSEADAGRTKQYQEEAKRNLTQANYQNYDEYLISLEMKACAKPFDKFHYSRIAQLTQRSNQFNLRTIRYTEDEIEKIAGSDEHITLYYTLEDKYGDYGLISVVILDKLNDEELFISEWLMSCRVLKRGMEEFIINKMVDTARANGFKKIIGEYIKTPKNAMVEHIYEKMGFKAVADNRYEMDAESYVNKKCYITEE